MSENNEVALRPEASQQTPAAVSPAVDVFEDASGITLLADMPGVPKEQLEIRVEGDELLIEGGVQQSTPECVFH